MSRTDETNGTDGTDGRAVFRAFQRVEHARDSLLVVQSMLAVIAATSDGIELDDEFRALADHLDALVRDVRDELELACNDAHKLRQAAE